MLYNKSEFHSYVSTAGKITVVTALFGVVAFTLIFLLNIGAKEFKQAVAQSVATTSIQVLNTPPAFAQGPFESPESSTSSPTNSGQDMTWTARAIDPSGEDYYLLICDGETASPTASQGSAPVCNGADKTWGVSSLTTSGAWATVSTTTLESFPESNDWYAWVCDSVPNARCNPLAQQGTGSTSSPFNVNHRPSFTVYSNDSPADPGTAVTFTSTASDPDTVDAQDTIMLHVCTTNSFDTVNDQCTATTTATSTFTASNPSAVYTLPNVIQDDDYENYGFVVDEHGHEALGGAQGTGGFTLTVSNVAPTISSSTISVNKGNQMVLLEGVETAADEFKLDFVVSDNNSCDAVGGANAYDEFATSTLSVFRSGVGSTTCDGTSGSYDPNNCYPSGVPSSVWNLQCTASSTTCSGPTDATITVECTFPLWFIADPTDGASSAETFYFNEVWTAAVSATDDDGASSPYTMAATSTTEVTSLLAINLLNATIPYGALEPGQDTGTLSASTTVESSGNTGLDEGLQGTDMCPGYTTGTPCSPSATSTIPAAEQEFATSEVAYGSGIALASTSATTLDISILKTTSTSTFSAKATYWGIAVPSSITYAGAYTGENTFTAVLSHPSEWY